MRSRVASAHRRHEEILARTPHNLGVGIVPSQRDRFECAFTGAVVQFEKPGFQGTLQCRPMVQGILNRLADRALGQDLRQLGLQPDVELVKDRQRSLSSQLMPQRDEGPVIGRISLFFRFAFDVVKQFDPCQCLMRPFRVTGPRLVELSSSVHHAADLDDLLRFVQMIVDGSSVGLEIALEILEDLLRPGATVVRRVTVDHVMIVVIANGSPESTGLDSFARMVLDGHRRVVILDDLGRQNPAHHQLDDWLQ